MKTNKFENAIMTTVETAYEDLYEIVKGISRQYAKDIHGGRAYDPDKQEEFEQELWMKSMEILTSDHWNGTAPVNLIAKSLWNHVTDVWNKGVRTSSNELLVDGAVYTHSTDYAEGSSNSVISAIESEANESYNLDVDRNQGLIDEILEIAKELDGNNDAMYKYVVAKLKLNGYLSEDIEPEIDVRGLDPEDITDGYYDVSQDKYILDEIHGYTTASTGGPGSFKGKKSELRRILLTVMNKEESYLTYYEVTYIESSKTESKWIKAYNSEDAVIRLETRLRRSLEVTRVVAE